MPNKQWINLVKDTTIERLDRKGVAISDNLQFEEGDWPGLIMEACRKMREAKGEIFAISNTPYEVWSDHKALVDSKLFAKAFAKAVKRFNERERMGEGKQREECTPARLEKLRKKFRKDVVAYAEKEAYKYAAKTIYEQASKEKAIQMPTLVEASERPNDLDKPSDDLDIPDGGEDPFLSFS